MRFHRLSSAVGANLGAAVFNCGKVVHKTGDTARTVVTRPSTTSIDRSVRSRRAQAQLLENRGLGSSIKASSMRLSNIA
jgi:hypothetical protein